MRKDGSIHSLYLRFTIGLLAVLSMCQVSNTFAKETKKPKIHTPTAKPTNTVQPKQAVFGTNVATISLNNLIIGGQWHYTRAYRFRARKSGSLSAIRVYWIYKFSKAGYHSGTGGVIRVSVRPDDGSGSHLPSSTVLTASDVTMNLCSPEEVAAAGKRLEGPCGNEGQFNRDGVRMTFEPIEFKPGTYLKKGSLYHVVFENIDRDPTTNWVSLDGLFHPGGLSRLLNNLPPPDGLTVLSRSETSKWDELSKTLPIVSIMLNGGEKNQANGGSEFGLGYVEGWGSWNLIPAVTKIVSARQTFTTNQRRRLTEVNIHIGHIEGDGSVSIELRDSKGRVLRSVDVLSNEFPSLDSCPWRSHFGSTPEPDTSCGIWVRRSISPPLIVNSGEHYSLVIRGNGAARFAMHLVEKGLLYNFGKATLFSEGSSDMSSDGGATWKPWVIWGSNRHDADLQFYLR
jgi:hypothetical protein